MKKTIILTLVILLTGCAYSTLAPNERADEIYDFGYIVGVAVRKHLPEYVDETRTIAATMGAAITVADLQGRFNEMNEWYEAAKRNDELEILALAYGARQLRLLLGAKINEDNTVDLSNVSLSEIKMALKGYLAGLG